MNFAYNTLISNLKNQVYKKILVLSGAGISVSSGIPDFRTPKVGLYSRVSEYGDLPFPEAIFEINYYQSNPKPFYKFCLDFLDSTKNYKPSMAHKFIKLLNDKNLLLMNFTQNIDGLELKANLPLNKIVQAHGHLRTCTCIKCKAPSDITSFFEKIKNLDICYCDKCKTGLVKPDIVFYGEMLPNDFYEKTDLMEKGDLIFIMGTGLQVFPFAGLIQKINDNSPVVYLNNERGNSDFYNPFLFIQGDIDQSLGKIVELCGWTHEIK